MEENKEEIRVRIAPSPTGPFHLGTARTALFNWLFAKHTGGKLILRIDDTDKERNNIKWEKEILEGLNWLGLNWDEGPILDQEDNFRTDNQKSLTLKEGYLGDYGPYHQSKRNHIYKKYLEFLLKTGRAYRCFCKPEELKAEKEAMIAAGQTPKYSGRCRLLSREQIENNLRKNLPYVIRIKTPEKQISFVDFIRGKIIFDMSLIGDFIISKGLDRPLYNFTSAIDDYEMKISHIIRGEDHISNTPKQIIIQEALGFPKVKYAHIPLILSPEKKKLSKREGALSIKELKEKGYLPQAILNFLSLLGWHPDEDKEFIPLEEIIKEFSLEKIQKSPAIFLPEKLNWLNSKYIKQTDLETLVELAKGYLKIPKHSEIKVEINNDYIKEVLNLYKERLITISEISEISDFFFRRINYSKELLFWKKATKEETINSLKQIRNKLSTELDWNKENINKILLEIADKVGDRGIVFWPLRVALSGKKASPPPTEIAEILGKQETLERISKAIEKLSTS